MGTVAFHQIAPLLKRTARERGLTYRAIGSALSLSESAVKKIFNGADCSINRLAQICDVLGLEVEEVVRTASKPPVRVAELTRAQQRFLVDNRDALHVYWKLVGERASIARIVTELGLSKPVVRRLLYQLDRHDLVRFDGKRATAPDLDHLVWGPEGPLTELVRREWSANVLRLALEQPKHRGHRVSLRYLRFTKPSMEEAGVAIDALLTDLERRAGLERRFGGTGQQHFSLLVATAAASPID